MNCILRNLRAISPVLAILMMIAVAIAGSLVTFAWVMGYIDFQTQKSGESIQIHSVANVGGDLVVYVQNVGETVLQLEEGSCLYVDGLLVACEITNVSVTQGIATLGLGETATLRYVGGVTLAGEQVPIKVTTKSGTAAEQTSCPAGSTPDVPVEEPLWSKAYGGTDYEVARYLIATSDGGYAIAGNTKSFGAGDMDCWLVKTDADGNMLWNQTYGGPETEQATAVVESSDGGYAIAGYTDSFGPGFYSFLLIKVDDFGNMQWNQTYSYNGICTAMVETSDRGYVLAGSNVLVKTDEFGNMEWVRTYNDTSYGDAEFRSLVATDDGGYALAGITNSGLGAYDFWLVKTDANGTVEWTRKYGGTSDEQAQSLVVTSDGGYALVGYTYSFGAGEDDFWLVKTDSNGNIEWDKTYGGTKHDCAYELVKTSDGGYVLVGLTESSGAGGQDFWLVKTDATGNVQWNQTYGGTENDWAWSLVEVSNGKYVLAGNTYSFGAGNIDFYLVKTG